MQGPQGRAWGQMEGVRCCRWFWLIAQPLVLEENRLKGRWKPAYGRLQVQKGGGSGDSACSTQPVGGTVSL